VTDTEIALRNIREEAAALKWLINHQAECVGFPAYSGPWRIIQDVTTSLERRIGRLEGYIDALEALVRGSKQ